MGPWKLKIFLPYSLHYRGQGHQLFVLQSLRYVNEPADPDCWAMYIHSRGRSGFYCVQLEGASLHHHSWLLPPQGQPLTAPALPTLNMSALKLEKSSILWVEIAVISLMIKNYIYINYNILFRNHDTRILITSPIRLSHCFTAKPLRCGEECALQKHLCIVWHLRISRHFIIIFQFNLKIGARKAQINVPVSLKC